MPLIDTTPILSSDPAGDVAAGQGRLITRRTLVTLRWLAILGQLVTVTTVHAVFDFPIPLLPLLATILVAALVNALGALYQARNRLSDYQVAANLAFDVIEISILLFLTGGLQNPFAVLILAPVTIAATVLEHGYVIGLSVLVLVVMAVLAFFHYPMPWGEDGPLQLPALYIAGVGTALSVSSLFIVFYVRSVLKEARSLAAALGETQLALAREQRMSSLGGLAAAAAHELGTPLATIALVAKEMGREIPEDSSLHEDVALLQSQSDRCREILAELSRNPASVTDPPMHRIRLSALIDTLVSSSNRSEIAINITEHGQGPAPEVLRSPELEHGLGNILSNALQFAQSRVGVSISWSEEETMVLVRDDGPGFRHEVLSRIGEPYISTRAHGREHMGLGIFIAQTLLERTGASIAFANTPDQGAEFSVRWNNCMPDKRADQPDNTAYEEHTGSPVPKE